MMLFTLLTLAHLHAETLTVPAQAGRLINHSTLPGSEFEVELKLTCQERSLSCGEWSWKIDVTDAGTYSAPAKTIEAVVRAGDVPQYTLSCKTNAKSNTIYARSIQAKNFLPRPAAEFDQLICGSFTIYEFEAADFQFSLASGKDLNEWHAGPGRDATFSVDFQLAPARPEDKGLIPAARFAAPEVAAWTRMPRRLLTYPGEFAADAPVKLRVVQNGEIKTIETRMSPRLDRMTGPIVINDAKDSGRPEQRRVDGIYSFGFMSILPDQRARARASLLGVAYATFDVRCRGGKIEGRVEFREEPDPGAAPVHQSAVAGTCDGDRGTLEFTLLGPANESVAVRAPFAKISAQAIPVKTGAPAQIQKQWWARQTHLPALTKFDEDARPERDFRPYLPLFDRDNVVLGYLYVQTQKARRN